MLKNNLSLKQMVFGFIPHHLFRKWLMSFITKTFCLCTKVRLCFVKVWRWRWFKDGMVYCFISLWCYPKVCFWKWSVCISRFSILSMYWKNLGFLKVDFNHKWLSNIEMRKYLLKGENTFFLPLSHHYIHTILDYHWAF